jgi:hypothetical protein
MPEEPGHGTAALALPKAKAAQFTPNPLVQALEFEPTGRVTIVGDPAHQARIEFNDHLRQANAPVPPGDLPDFLLRAFDTLGRDPELAVQK